MKIVNNIWYITIIFEEGDHKNGIFQVFNKLVKKKRIRVLYDKHSHEWHAENIKPHRDLLDWLMDIEQQKTEPLYIHIPRDRKTKSKKKTWRR